MKRRNLHALFKFIRLCIEFAQLRPLHILRAPRIGEMLTTTVEVKEDIFSTTLVETFVEASGETIATCSMKIFLTDRVPTTA